MHVIDIGPSLVGNNGEAFINFIKLLLDQGKANVNAKDINDNTALLKATKKHYSRIEDMLIEKGADPSIKNDLGETAAKYKSSQYISR